MLFRSAKGDVGFTLGLLLGNAADVLNKTTTTVASLNSDAGVKLNTNLALTSLGAIDPLVGRLSADAHFAVTTLVGTTFTDYLITLTKAATSDNKALGDLLADLNAALGTAGLSGKIAAESDPVQGSTKTARLVLRAVDPAIKQFQVSASTNDTAYTEIGRAHV